MNRTQEAAGVFVTNLSGEKFKKCKVSVYMVLPGERKTATAMAVLPHILGRNCAEIPDPLTLSRRLYKLYGASLSSSSFQAGANRVVTLGISGVKPEFALDGEDLEKEYLDLLCNLLFAPKLENGVFSAQDLMVEKTKQADYLRSERNDKRSYALRQARRKLYGDSLNGLESSGYLEDIDGLTPEILYACYQNLLKTAQFEIVAVGMDGQKAAAHIAQYLEKFIRVPATPQWVDVLPKAQSIQHAEEAMDTAQGKLCLLLTAGQPADTKKLAAMRLAVAIFGSMPTSRLFTNVREKQGLCYYCAASYSNFSGVLCVDSGVEHENAQKASESILHELEVLQKELVSEEELENALVAMTSSLKAVLDSPSAMEGWVINEYLRGTSQTLEQAEDMLRQVTREDIRLALAEFTPALQFVLTKKEAN